MSQAELEIPDEEIGLFLENFKVHSNYDFTNYSIKSLKRRLAKILNDSKLSLQELEKEILRNPEFLEKVVMSITVNTTELFRDPQVWIRIRDEVLPAFKHYDKLNIWHAGCSTGQEVYSLMILLEEAGMLSKSNIYASDINTGVLDTARKGKFKYRFNQSYIENFNWVLNDEKVQKTSGLKVPCSRYFTIDKVADFIQMHPNLTEKPVYRKIDLVTDENLFYVKFDLVICRNVIIYFNYELQNKVFNLFYKNMFSNGCLVLGLHESILGPYSSLFEKKNVAYYKKEKH